MMSLHLASGMSYFAMKAMVSVVVARRQISLPKDLLHTSLFFRCFNRWQYSRRSPVLLLITADEKLQRNHSGNLRDAVCRVVKG